jgi:hypothetical protein
MDYIMLSALAPVLVLGVFISYDIACQFKVNFFDRMEALPNHLKLPDNVSTDWGIPKCHCPMHKLPCQAPHSLNFKSGVGRTDGEGIERSWAEMNRVANSTKEMGPGSRHDTLDDHFGHHNWRKYVSLGKFCPFFIALITNLLSPSGTTLHSRLLLAVKEQKRQEQIFNEFTDSLREGGKINIEQWTAMILAWEQDPSKTNPYVSLVTRKFLYLILSCQDIYVPCSRCIAK